MRVSESFFIHAGIIVVLLTVRNKNAIIILISDIDFAFFQEAYIDGNNEAWEQTDCINKSKLVALDTTYVVKFRSQDKHAGIYTYQGKEVKSGKKYEGYHSCDANFCINGKISKATYEKKYKEFMSGTKKIKNFDKNTSANRAKLKK